MVTQSSRETEQVTAQTANLLMLSLFLGTIKATTDYR